MNRINQNIILKDGRKLGFAEYGKVNGYPIIYCHGSQSSRLEIHYDHSFAIENDLRIIIIDRPGHGISDFNPNGSILEFARDAKQLIAHLEIDKLSVAGMSAGSPFALGMSYLLPENIYKTSIISGFAPYNQEITKYLSSEVKIMLYLAKTFPILFKVLIKIQAKQIIHKPKKILNGFLRIMSEPDQKTLKNQLVINTIESMFKEAFRNGSKGVAYEISNLLVRNWEFDLNEIQVPVTFWQGKKDNNVPFEWAQYMSHKIKGANLKIFPEKGHLLIFEHAKEIFKDLKNIA